MNLINEVVEHIKFGTGTIIEEESDKVIVKFDEKYGEKVLLYPDGFEHFLKLENTSLQELVLEELSVKKEQIELEKEMKRQEIEKHMEELEMEKKKKKPAKKK